MAEGNRRLHSIKILQKLKDPLAKQFYIQTALKNGWSLRVLDHQIDLIIKEEYTFDFLEKGVNQPMGVAT